MESESESESSGNSSESEIEENTREKNAVGQEGNDSIERESCAEFFNFNEPDAGSEINFNSAPTSDVRSMIAQQEFERLRGMPTFETYVKKVVAEQMGQEKKKDNGKGKGIDRRKGKRVEEQSEYNGGKVKESDLTVKSPSDMTIYAPALNQVGPLNKSPVRTNLVEHYQTAQVVEMDNTRNMTSMTENAKDKSGDQKGITEQIINFFEGIRMQDAGSNQADGSRQE